MLTTAAEADIRSIVRYTRRQWGDAQVRTYMARLDAGLVRLAAGQGAYRDLSEIHAGLRMARCEHHNAFCLVRKDSPALIIAILHERMDLIQRLADRLE